METENKQERCINAIKPQFCRFLNFQFHIFDIVSNFLLNFYFNKKLDKLVAIIIKNYIFSHIILCIHLQSYLFI